MHRVLRTIKDIVVVAGCTAAGLALLEGFLTLLYPDSNAVLMPERAYLYKLRPDTIHVAHLSAPNGGGKVESRTNRWGFRGPDVDPAKQQLRVMVYGDSNIHAEFSPWECTFAARLGTWLTSLASIHVEVINAGVNGYGPDQVALRLEDEIDRWQPDVVIVDIFADNDLGDLLRNNLFRLDDRGRAYVTTEGWAGGPDWLTRTRIYRAAARLQRSLNEWLRKETAVAHLTRLTEEDFKSYRNNERAVSHPDHYDIDVSLDPQAESSQLKLSVFNHVVEHISQTVARRHGTRLAFLIQPSSRDISTNLSLNYKRLAELSPQYDRRNLSSQIEAVLRSHGLTYLNVFDEFAVDGRTPYYFCCDDDHWNDAGQDKAAKIAARFLVDHGLISAATGDPTAQLKPSMGPVVRAANRHAEHLTAAVGLGRNGDGRGDRDDPPGRALFTQVGPSHMDTSKNLGEAGLICSTVACSGGGSKWGVRPGFSMSRSGWLGCRRKATSSSACPRSSTLKRSGPNSSVPCQGRSG
jgi:hypothetical protein